MVGGGGGVVVTSITRNGITYLFYRLGWTVIRVIRNQPTLARRITGTLIAVGAVALMAFLWTS